MMEHQMHLPDMFHANTVEQPVYSDNLNHTGSELTTAPSVDHHGNEAVNTLSNSLTHHTFLSGATHSGAIDATFAPSDEQPLFSGNERSSDAPSHYWDDRGCIEASLNSGHSHIGHPVVWNRNNLTFGGSTSLTADGSANASQASPTASSESTTPLAEDNQPRFGGNTWEKWQSGYVYERTPDGTYTGNWR